MRLRFVLAAAALLAFSGFAHADTISIFNLNATLAYGSATGTVTLDATTGNFTAANINVATSAGNSTFSGVPTIIAATGYSDLLFTNSTVSGYAFELALPSASLRGYTGGSLCSAATPTMCSANASAVQASGVDVDAVTSGTLTLAPAAAVTPEPSSLLLLGTGVLVVGGFLRKRTA